MKLIVVGKDQLVRTRSIAKDTTPLEVLVDLDGVKAELVDENAVCFRRAEYQMNGEGWVCVMDRTGQSGPRPKSRELARELPIDMTMILCELTRRERRSRGKAFELPDWERVVTDLTQEGFVQLTDDGGLLTNLGRMVGMDLIDMGY